MDHECAGVSELSVQAHILLNLLVSRYCDSRDCDFLISYHDRYPSLFLATGGSGHAFKVSRTSWDATALITEHYEQCNQFLPTIGDLCVQAIDRMLPEPLATMWSFTRVRQDYQPDRGTSVRLKLDPAEFANDAELAQ